MDETIENFRAVARKALDAVQASLLDFRHEAEFEHLFKPDGSPVTSGDKAAEKLIIQIIREAFPTHRLHGEEFGLQNAHSDSPYLWAFDPIDGTWSYLNFETTASIVMTVFKQDEPLLGMVCNPFTNELFEAVRGEVSTLNDRPLPLAKCDALEHGVMDYHFPRLFHAEIEKILAIWVDDKIGKLISQRGSIAYALACVAKGSHSVLVLPPKPKKLDPWDISAGILLIENAGGQVTDLNGVRVDPLTHSGYLVATTSQKMHTQTLTLFEQYGLGRQTLATLEDAKINN